MSEPAPFPKATIFEWIGSAVIVFVAVVGGIFCAFVLGHLMGLNFPGADAIMLCVGAVPVVWLAKRAGCLEGFTWQGLLLLAIATALTFAVIDLLAIPVWQMHMLQACVMGVVMQIARHYQLLPHEKDEETSLP